MMHVPRGRRRPPRTHGDPRRPRRRRGWFGRGSWGRKKSPDRTIVGTPVPSLPMPPPTASPPKRKGPSRPKEVRRPPRTHGDPPPRRRPGVPTQVGPAKEIAETATVNRQTTKQQLDKAMFDAINKDNLRQQEQLNAFQKLTPQQQQAFLNRQPSTQQAKRVLNKGGLMRKGHNDMRKKGLFK